MLGVLLRSWLADLPLAALSHRMVQTTIAVSFPYLGDL